MAGSNGPWNVRAHERSNPARNRPTGRATSKGQRREGEITPRMNKGPIKVIDLSGAPARADGDCLEGPDQRFSGHVRLLITETRLPVGDSTTLYYSRLKDLHYWCGIPMLQ